MKVPKWLNSWPSTAGKGLFFRQGGYFAFARRLLRRPKPGQDHGPMAAVIAFIFGFAVSIGAFFTVQSLYRADALKGFEGPAAQFTVAVSQSLERYLEILNAVGAFFAASNEVDRWEFFEFARETLPRYQGVTALTWVPRVLDEEREAFEHRARDDGLFGFRFKDLGGGAEQTTAAARDVHYPVFYVEPFEGNDQRLGVDLAGRPADLAILHEARDSGSVRIARLDSQDAGARAPNHVIVLPVYRLGKVPETLADRKGELLGFARAHIALPELVAAALPGPAAPPGLDIYIYDDSAEPGRRLVTYFPSTLRSQALAPLGEEEVRSGLYSVTHHTIGARDWSIVVKPVASYPHANVQMAAWGVFAFGILTTLLLVQYLVASHLKTRLIERAVTKRTTELHETNEALESEILERERAECKLREAKQRAEMASRAKSDFLAMMSHELRTPLNAVIGFSELLRDQTLGPLGNEQYRDYAEHIRSSGAELLARINDILELTKIDSEDFSLLVEPLDLVDIFRAVDPMVREKATVGALKLTSDFATDLPRLDADPRALKQILYNLLSNAIKFTPTGGRVDVSAKMDRGGRMILQVSDSGVGIDPEHLADVLQPFSQADSSLGRKFEGTGLGLALTHRLVRLHDAELSIDSELGTGTTVAISFPKSRVLGRTSATKAA